MARVKSMKKKTKIQNTIIYIFLVLLSIIWLIPIAYILFISFHNDNSKGAMVTMPDYLTFQHYINLFAKGSQYPQWFLNTLIVALVTMVINTFFVMAVAYTMSRLRFKSRKTLMSINLILGMFPGFMSMIAIYNILKLVKLDQTLVGLTLCYTMTSGMGFYVAKGFFDTISRSLDEAARIDGATNAQIFYKIILPLSKPIIVYTLVQSFMGPWMDYIFCNVILRNKSDQWTVAMGMYKWLNTQEKVNTQFVDFFAGSVLISIPIMSVFLATQKYYIAGVTGGAVKG
ncbi:MAG: sugar ABC transporter permease [Bacillales bacterium]|nr:sugar ABC transporter permease [Bacillales bacterium]